MSHPSFLGGKAVSLDGIIKRDKMEPHRRPREEPDRGGIVWRAKQLSALIQRLDLETRECQAIMVFPEPL